MAHPPLSELLPHPLTCANACIYDAYVPCDIGFPIISHFTKKIQTTGGGFNLGGTNATGQVPVMPGQRGLIDKDTPLEVYSKKSWMNPSQEMILVFSDEFNEDGRTFYPGDDPYWEAVDLHYWVTVRTLVFFGLCVCVWSERGVDGTALLLLYIYRTIWNGTIPKARRLAMGRCYLHCSERIRRRTTTWNLALEWWADFFVLIFLI